VGESGKGNGKVRVGDNVLHVNRLPYLAEAYTSPTQYLQFNRAAMTSYGLCNRLKRTQVTMNV